MNADGRIVEEYWCARALMMERDLNHSQSVIGQAILMLEDGDVDDAIMALRNERDNK